MTSRRRMLGAAGLALLSRRIFAVEQSPRWQRAAPIPIKTQELYPAVHQGKLYVAGGIAARLGVPYFTNACFAYDPGSDQWHTISSLPEERHHAALVSDGARLFNIGGFNGGYRKVWRMRDSVYELTAEGWQPAGLLPQPQAEGVVACRHDGAIHLVTGQSPKGTANSARSDHAEINAHWRWDGTSARWEAAAPIPTPRNSATGGWVDDQLIVTGGRTGAGNLAVTEIYDAADDRWRTAAPLPLPQAGTAGVALDDGLVVCGGEIFRPTAGVFASVWRYLLREDRWVALPDLPTPRHGLGAGRVGNKIYVVGGATEPGGSGTTDINEVLLL